MPQPRPGEICLPSDGLRPFDAQTGADVEGQAGIADGGNVAAAGQVLRLRVDL